MSSSKDICNIQNKNMPIDIPVVEGVHSYGTEEDWVEPQDPLVRERLEWFKDQKLGLFMHWGLYSQIGVMESCFYLMKIQIGRKLT